LELQYRFVDEHPDERRHRGEAERTGVGDRGGRRKEAAAQDEIEDHRHHRADDRHESGHRDPAPDELAISGVPEERAERVDQRSEEAAEHDDEEQPLLAPHHVPATESKTHWTPEMNAAGIGGELRRRLAFFADEALHRGDAMPAVA